MSVNNYPVKNLVSKPIFGLNVSRASATTLEISEGRCRDSSNKMDLSVGSDFENLQGSTVSAPLTVDPSAVGAGGIDAGALAANKVYAVYVIGDSQGYKQTAGMLSLASNSTPTMPFEYNAYRLVGYALTNGSSQFILMNQSGEGHLRRLMLDAPLVVAANSTNTSYSAIDLSAAVAPQDNAMVYLQVDQEAVAAANLVNVQKFGGTGDTLSQRAAYATGTGTWTGHVHCPVGLDSGAPKVNAKVSAGDYSLYVIGFEFDV